MPKSLNIVSFIQTEELGKDTVNARKIVTLEALVCAGSEHALLTTLRSSTDSYIQHLGLPRAGGGLCHTHYANKTRHRWLEEAYATPTAPRL